MLNPAIHQGSALIRPNICRADAMQGHHRLRLHPYIHGVLTSDGFQPGDIRTSFTPTTQAENGVSRVVATRHSLNRTCVDVEASLPRFCLCGIARPERNKKPPRPLRQPPPSLIKYNHRGENAASVVNEYECDGNCRESRAKKYLSTYRPASRIIR